MRAKSLFPLLCLLTVGCKNIYTVHFESEPPGARVFFGAGPNEDMAKESYIGQTPVAWEYEGDGDRRFKNEHGIPFYSDFVKQAIVFRAEPPNPTPGLYEQRQVFHSPALFQAGDRIPDKIFFDLRKPPATPR